MAEFLVYNKDHWYDLPSKDRPSMTGYENNHFKIDNDVGLALGQRLTPAQKIKNKGILTQKYAAHVMRGDICEARQNDIGMVGKEPLSYALVKVPSMTIKNAQKYMDEDRDSVDKDIIFHRRKYQIDLAQIVLDSRPITIVTSGGEEISAEYKDTSITLDDFNRVLRAK